MSPEEERERRGGGACGGQVTACSSDSGGGGGREREREEGGRRTSKELPVLTKNGGLEGEKMSTVNNAREEISRAYNAVRDDSDETNWLVLKHRGTQIVVDSTGSSFSDFESKFTDDERAFGFIRIVTGDEMSKRAKFAFITWIGSQVGILKKAKMSTDIAEVKELIRNFAVELHLGEKEELEESHIREKLTKAGGANYGTGQ